MEKAAVNIQKLYRGFRARRALTLDFRVSLGTELEKDSTDADTYTADDGRRKEPKKAVHIVQSVNMLERCAKPEPALHTLSFCSKSKAVRCALQPCGCNGGRVHYRAERSDGLQLLRIVAS